jgi:glycerol kinase
VFKLPFHNTRTPERPMATHDDNSAPLLAAIDQGTSSSRFIVFVAAPGKPTSILASHQEPLHSITPKPG